MDFFIEGLKKQGILQDFDAELWCSLVQFVTVNGKEDIRVMFRDGT